MSGIGANPFPGIKMGAVAAMREAAAKALEEAEHAHNVRMAQLRARQRALIASVPPVNYVRAYIDRKDAADV